MDRRMIQSISGFIFFSLAIVLFPYLAQAQQPEPSVECVEGVPNLINYGEHTTGCAIGPAPSDRDGFEFVGSTGDEIRVIVDVTLGNLRPRLEIRDPDNVLILDQNCGTGAACTVLVDLTLGSDGTYSLAVSDNFINNTGDYTLQLESFPPVSPGPPIDYDQPVVTADQIQHFSDLDFFVFEGAAGTEIRVIVDVTLGNLRPRLEIRDPDNVLILDQNCGTGAACTVLVDLTLGSDGTYSLAVSDNFINNTGDYDVALFCLSGSCPEVIQPVVCDIQLNQDVFVDGETVIANVFRAANPGASPMSIEIKTWFELPDMAPPMGDLRLGADGSIVLAPGFDTDFGPRILFTVTPAMARGNYQFGCRFLDPVTGRQKTLDLNPFEIVE